MQYPMSENERRYWMLQTWGEDPHKRDDGEDDPYFRNSIWSFDYIGGDQHAVD